MEYVRSSELRFFRCLAEDCPGCSYYRAANDYLEKLPSLVDAPNEKAECLLRMGQAMEQSRDCEPSLKAHSRFFQQPATFEPQNPVHRPESCSLRQLVIVAVAASTIPANLSPSTTPCIRCATILHRIQDPSQTVSR